jgi:phosphoenolpyruvate carboxykinase (ATP)
MSVDLSSLNITNVNAIHRNLSTPALYELAIRRREGLVSHLGPLVTRTGHYTGRSPHDRFIVEEPSTSGEIWWGKENRPFDAAQFDALHARLAAYLQGKDVFVQDCYAGADPDYRMRLRIITEDAWHSMFARNMFIQEPDPDRLDHFEPEYTVINAPGFKAIPELDGTRSEAFVLAHLAERLIIIGGTSYAGEIKKSVFSVLNFLLPERDVLSMHCSANVGEGGDTAIFFGLSGTGKTTLSTDSDRSIIGDDEHGWSDNGIFNFEGGCYAKVIRLDPIAEPEIFQCTRRFGTLLENVALDMGTRRVDLDDSSLTENTRASYPITHLPNAVRDGRGGHPDNVVMLTCDAFGIMPPIARLTPEQAMYHYISGYTAKIPGTERGVQEPKAVFSACFGAPFMTRHPSVYAKLLKERIVRHGSACWLVNTGWTGGSFGEGRRMEIAQTRAMVRAALTGALNSVETERESVFGFEIPKSCPGVSADVLDPVSTWKNRDLYEAKAARLVEMFEENFTEYVGNVDTDVAAAGPKASRAAGHAHP